MKPKRGRLIVAGATLGTVLTAFAAVAVGLFTGSGTAAPTAPPTNTSPPTITGAPQEGQDLTAHPGGWSRT